MINTITLTKQFIEEKYNEYKKINKRLSIQLMEKNIYALYLLELLQRTGLNFIFKGGTSLILLLNEVKRLSIDIDILVDENIDMEKFLKKVVETSNLFYEYEENIRQNSASSRMKLRHFKFNFISKLDNESKYILLDVAYETNKYSKVNEIEINCDLLKVDSIPIYVTIPTVESILGDKLCVIAPNTTGIGYESHKELELMKQLYDIDKLFNESNNVKEIKESFIEISTRELEYRKLNNLKYNNVLDDILDFCKILVIRGNYKREKLNKILIGVKKFPDYMLTSKFLIDIQILTAVSKIMYLVSIIKTNKDIIEKYNGQDILEGNISIEFKRLFKIIKEMNKEAYYYLIKSGYFV